MRTRFDEQLTKLNNKLIEMGMYIEENIALAIRALVEKDIQLAQKAIDLDRDINALENEIESMCLKLLLQQQPVAKDLRLISSALKMITDMERIGDQAADISEISIILANAPLGKELVHIPKMAQATTKMVRDSIDAFVKKDLELAHEVIAYDDVVDELFTLVKSELIALIRSNSEEGEYAIDYLMIAKYFERIGDHATNIAEWVVFSITGIHKDQKII